MEEVEEIESGDGDCGTTMGVRDEVEEMEEMPIPTLKRITTRPTDRPKGMTTVTVDGLEGYRRHRSRKLLRRVGVRILVALLGAVMVIGLLLLRTSSLPAPPRFSTNDSNDPFHSPHHPRTSQQIILRTLSTANTPTARSLHLGACLNLADDETLRAEPLSAVSGVVCKPLTRTSQRAIKNKLIGGL
ncbi:hypothetical protein EX30DRAFT_341826 [Ascodesmis nigricans]|uniref:Uncharacterized protein n=1 Tax=Ascodesmis nigricans TaxID=341454 RepID=A0A4S2MU12_9PEZI|nr:hypothetical protein EX30DRAFT_341826 [Ascodesmis nigricans]